VFKKHSSVVGCITRSARAASPRAGREHVYTLNGSRLRDVFVGGQWITVSVSDPAVRRAAA